MGVPGFAPAATPSLPKTAMRTIFGELRLRITTSETDAASAAVLALCAPRLVSAATFSASRSKTVS